MAAPAVVALAFAAVAAAQQPVIMRISHQVPPAHHMTKLLESFAADVKARTNGGVEVQLYGSEQLAKAALNFRCRARDDRGGDERQLPVGDDDPRDERDADPLRDERPRADQALPDSQAQVPRREARPARRQERRVALHHARDHRHLGRS